MYAHFFFTSKTMRTVIMIPMVIGVAQHLGYPPISLALASRHRRSFSAGACAEFY